MKKSILKNGIALKNFYELEKSFLLLHYPGLTLERLKQDFKLLAFIHGIDNGTNADDIFERPYLNFASNPLTIFFEKLKQGIPLEYITGYRYFYKSLFKVSEDVLIPRSETEILVEEASLYINKSPENELSVIDLCCGSGAIGLSVLMESKKKLNLWMTDISSKALKVSKENYHSLKYCLNPEHEIHFVQTDRFHNLNHKFDLICTNPPYIKRKSDLSGVHTQVHHHEPHIALYLDDEIYEEWFNELFKSAFLHLNDSGVMIMEGHEDHLEYQSGLAKNAGFKTSEIKKDYTNRNRFLILKK